MYKTAKRAAWQTIKRTAEKKYLDVNYAIGSNGAVSNLGWANAFLSTTFPAQGTNRNMRIGNKILLVGIKYDFTFQSGDSTNVIRWGIARMKDDGSMATGALSPLYQSGCYNPLDTDLTKFYTDKKIYLGAYTNYQKQRKGYWKFNKQIHFDDVAGKIFPNYILWLVSDSAAATHPGFNGYIRIYYIDL